MAEIAQNYTTGNDVYIRVYKTHTDGTRKVYNYATPGWEDYSALSIADYASALAGEEGATGNYVIDIATAIADHGDMRWVEWYDRAGAVAVESDAQINAYLVAYDQQRTSFMPPSFGYGRYPSVQQTDIVRVGGVPVNTPRELGLQGRSYTNLFVPVSPTLGSYLFVDDSYSIGAAGVDTAFRNSSDIDPDEPFEFHFYLFAIPATLNLYVGLMELPDDIEDVSATLIDPGETNAAKTLFKSGFIMRAGDVSEMIYGIDGSSLAVASTVTITMESTTFIMRWEPLWYKLSLLSIDSENHETELLTISGLSNLYQLVNGSSLAVGFSFSGIVPNEGFYIFKSRGYGTGYCGSATHPTQPRNLRQAGPGFRLAISSRADGTHKCTRALPLREGAVGSIAVGIDMSPLFGSTLVTSVGTPTVVPSTGITVAAIGPWEQDAMVTIAGTAVADATYVVTVPITMDTGEVVDVDFDVEAFSE